MSCNDKVFPKQCHGQNKDSSAPCLREHLLDQVAEMLNSTRLPALIAFDLE